MRIEGYHGRILMIHGIWHDSYFLEMPEGLVVYFGSIRSGSRE